MKDMLLERLNRLSQGNDPVTSALSWRRRDKEGFLMAHQTGLFREIAQARSWKTDWLPLDLPKDAQEITSKVIKSIKSGSEAIPLYAFWKDNQPDMHGLAEQAGVIGDVRVALGWNNETTGATFPPETLNSLRILLQRDAKTGIASPSELQDLAEGLLRGAAHLDGTAGAMRAFLGNTCPDEPITRLYGLSQDFKTLSFDLMDPKMTADIAALAARIEDLFKRTEDLQKALLSEIRNSQKGKGFFGSSLDHLKAAAIAEIAKGVLIFSLAATFNVDASHSGDLVEAGRSLRGMVMEVIVPEAPDAGTQQIRDWTIEA